MSKENEMESVVGNATIDENLFISSCLIRKHLEEIISLNDLIKQATMIDFTIKDIPLHWTNLVYCFLNKEPYSFWDKAVCECTFRGIEKIFLTNSESCAEGMYDALRHFMIAYFAFEELIKVIDSIEPISENSQIKTRMYRIPTYINIVEGCLSNLYKAIRDLLDYISEKDLKSQTKLQGLCDVMTSNGYDDLVQYIDIDIRNAINHGGILLSEEEASFFYMKSNIQQKKNLRYYEFDNLIEKNFDCISGIIMGLLRFLSIYPEVLATAYCRIEENNDFFLKTSLARLLYSFPGTQCKFISTDIEGQLDLDFVTDIVDTTKLIYTIFEIAIICQQQFPDYKQYFFAFKGERMLSGWARFSGEEIEACSNPENIIPVLEKALREVRIFIPPASDEIIDMDMVKYHRFPIINKNNWKIRDIMDCSLPNVKRLKACLYLGNIQGRRKIIKVVEEAVEEIRVLFNPPQPGIKVKHGNITADVVFLNVYYKYDRRKNRQLYPSNDNFVLVAEYCTSEIAPINHGIPEGLLRSLISQKMGGILYSWNPTSYHAKCKS